ncbi:MAG: metal ABC transporter substrate-binding protein [Arenicella sp.]
MKKLFLYLVIFLPLLSACDNSETSQPEQDTEKTRYVVAEESKSIVTSFYPLAFMAEQIVKDKAQVINMAGSVDVHAYEPSPQDLVKLNQANLVIFQGAELEPWTDGVIPELKSKGGATLEVSHHLELAKMEEHGEHEDEHKGSEQGKHHDELDKDQHDESKEGKHQALKEDKHEGSEDGHHEEEGHHDEHHHGEYDPHTWLDPILAQQMVDEILEAVVAIDSANKTFYQSNAQILKGKFAQLDKDFQSGLAQCGNKELIISHDAYGYLARRYNFEAHTITGFSPHDEPSAKILAELKEEAKEGITHILVEENNVRRFADTLARETGLATLPANPLGRGTLDSQKNFFDVMNENLNSFKIALNCRE